MFFLNQMAFKCLKRIQIIHLTLIENLKNIFLYIIPKAVKMLIKFKKNALKMKLSKQCNTNYKTSFHL